MALSCAEDLAEEKGNWLQIAIRGYSSETKGLIVGGNIASNNQAFEGIPAQSAPDLQFVQDLLNVGPIARDLLSHLSLLGSLHRALESQYSVFCVIADALLVEPLRYQRPLVVLLDSIVDVGSNASGLGLLPNWLNADLVN